jgi:trehalose 6-phosphate phosphatase
MLPALNPNSALFLDIDGTLIDIAATPQAVKVPLALPAELRQTQAKLEGALAILSGRKLSDIDNLLGPGLPCASEHGALLRDASGNLTHKARRLACYDKWLQCLQAEITEMPGVLIEEKEYSLVVHYRQAPQFEAELSQLVDHLVGSSDDAVLMLAHCAFELRPRGGNKADALSWFMQHPPFAGRIPVFIGDDITDEPAIEKAIELGGIGLHVARDFAGRTQAVRDWIIL